MTLLFEAILSGWFRDGSGGFGFDMTEMSRKVTGKIPA
jgi:hypothetical protein